MARFERLLVPLDGSPLAEQALEAVDLFERAGCRRVALVRVVDDDQAEADAYLKDVAARLGRNLEVTTSTPHGQPAEAILAEVARVQADVLAMATHGRSGLGRVLYGSVAEAVLEHTPVPVLLTRAWQGARTEPTPGAVDRVLVPLDGSPPAEAVVPVVAALASTDGGAELVLLRVIEPPHQMLTGWVPGVVYSDVGTETDQAEADVYLRGLAERLAREHGVPSAKIQTNVRVGRSIDAILEAAEEYDASLLCMVTHAQSRLGRVIVGTVTDGVLRRGAKPLLLVPPASA